MSASADPRTLTREEFVTRFGHVFEDSPWLAEAAFDAGLPADAHTAAGLHRALSAAMRAASRERRLALIRAHPDLAGRLARAGTLSRDSTKEQAGAGLDRLTDAEYQSFTALNAAYREKFAMPFIMAIKGRRKAEILAAFVARLGNDQDSEVATALAEIERIALLRLRELLP